MAQFKDDKMEYIESDIEKIQMKTASGKRSDSECH